MKIFLSGIGGIGMSAYASHMKQRGHDVSGSDRADSDVLYALTKQGISVSLKQDGSAMPDNIDLFVYSEAIPDSSPERIKAASLNIRQISYFAALGELTAGTDLIAVCGTHGKSSTTAMAARVFMEAGKDPNVVVGTKMSELGGRNWKSGKSDLWIVEACEYRRSFLYLKPKVILVTNADGDHFDAFKNQGDYQKAFAEFISSLPDDGIVIGHGEDSVVRDIVAKTGKKFIDADSMQLVSMQTPGLHMRKNAQLVLALAKQRGIDPTAATTALEGFAGTWRRMEKKGKTKQGAPVIDDYAHHPVEIKATLAAMKEAHPGKRIVCVFQPHTHDRTMKLWDAFAEAFRDADLVIIPNVYDARPDKDSVKVNVDDFCALIQQKSDVECLNATSLAETSSLLSGLVKPNDLVITMGAGDITNLAQEIVVK